MEGASDGVDEKKEKRGQKGVKSLAKIKKIWEGSKTDQPQPQSIIV